MDELSDIDCVLGEECNLLDKEEFRVEMEFMSAQLEAVLDGRSMMTAMVEAREELQRVRLGLGQRDELWATCPTQQSKKHKEEKQAKINAAEAAELEVAIMNKIVEKLVTTFLGEGMEEMGTETSDAETEPRRMAAIGRMRAFMLHEYEVQTKSKVKHEQEASAAAEMAAKRAEEEAKAAAIADMSPWEAAALEAEEKAKAVVVAKEGEDEDDVDAEDSDNDDEEEGEEGGTEDDKAGEGEVARAVEAVEVDQGPVDRAVLRPLLEQFLTVLMQMRRKQKERELESECEREGALSQPLTNGSPSKAAAPPLSKVKPAALQTVTPKSLSKLDSFTGGITGSAVKVSVGGLLSTIRGGVTAGVAGVTSITGSVAGTAAAGVTTIAGTAAATAAAGVTTVTATVGAATAAAAGTAAAAAGIDPSRLSLRSNSSGADDSASKGNNAGDSGDEGGTATNEEAEDDGNEEAGEAEAHKSVGESKQAKDKQRRRRRRERETLFIEMLPLANATDIIDSAIPFDERYFSRFELTQRLAEHTTLHAESRRRRRRRRQEQRERREKKWNHRQQKQEQQQPAIPAVPLSSVEATAPEVTSELIQKAGPPEVGAADQAQLVLLGKASTEPAEGTDEAGSALAEAKHEEAKHKEANESSGRKFWSPEERNIQQLISFYSTYDPVKATPEYAMHLLGKFPTEKLEKALMIKYGESVVLQEMSPVKPKEKEKERGVMLDAAQGTSASGSAQGGEITVGAVAENDGSGERANTRTNLTSSPVPASRGGGADQEAPAVSPILTPSPQAPVRLLPPGGIVGGPAPVPLASPSVLADSARLALLREMQDAESQETHTIAQAQEMFRKGGLTEGELIRLIESHAKMEVEEEAVGAAAAAVEARTNAEANANEEAEVQAQAEERDELFGPASPSPPPPTDATDASPSPPPTSPSSRTSTASPLAGLAGGPMGDVMCGVLFVKQTGGMFSLDSWPQAKCSYSPSTNTFGFDNGSGFHGSGRLKAVTQIGDRGGGKRPNRFDVIYLDSGGTVALSAASAADMDAWVAHMNSVIAHDWMS
jgi:hypothetical protein